MLTEQWASRDQPSTRAMSDELRFDQEGELLHTSLDQAILIGLHRQTAMEGHVWGMDLMVAMKLSSIFLPCPSGLRCGSSATPTISYLVYRLSGTARYLTTTTYICIFPLVV